MRWIDCLFSFSLLLEKKGAYLIGCQMPVHHSCSSDMQHPEPQLGSVAKKNLIESHSLDLHNHLLSPPVSFHSILRLSPAIITPVFLLNYLAWKVENNMMIIQYE